MSSSSEGRERVAAQIPAALRAVLTTAQQYLLMDTVMPVTVGDLRRAILDPAYAAQLTQRAQQPVEMPRAFTPRPASDAELAVVAERRGTQYDETVRRITLEERRYAIADEQSRRRREEAAAAVARRRRAEEERQQEVTRQRELADTRRRLQAAARQTAENRRRPPNQRQPSSGSPQPFADAIRSMSRSPGHQPGHVPVLGGQANAREETLAQARANRVPIDWDSETMWRLNNAPRITPAVRISHMPDQQLMDEIDIAVTHVARIFQLYADAETVWTLRGDLAAVDQAKRWLALQSAFRALVQEAVRRSVSFSGSTYLYITQFVLGASSNAQLADFVNHPVRVVTEESVVDTFGRSGRALRLDDD